MPLNGKTHSFHVLSNLTEDEEFSRRGDREFAIVYNEDDIDGVVRALNKKRSAVYWAERRPILTLT